jgi:hypothetical protein
MSIATIGSLLLIAREPGSIGGHVQCKAIRELAVAPFSIASE